MELLSYDWAEDKKRTEDGLWLIEENNGFWIGINFPSFNPWEFANIEAEHKKGSFSLLFPSKREED